MTTAVTTSSSAPVGTVTRDDLERKFRQLRGDVTNTARSYRKTVVTVGAAVVVTVVAVSFLWVDAAARDSAPSSRSDGSNPC